LKNWNVRKAVIAPDLLPEEHRLKKTLSWPHLIFLGVGAIVGTGILVLIGTAAGKAGPAMMLSFVIAGAICGLAGALLVNQTAYLTPEFMNWTRSGELMFMVILGGMGTTAGPLFGAAALLLLEDLLQGWSVLPKLVHEYWQFYLGIVLVLVVLFAKRGLAGLLRGGGDGADG